MIGGEIGGDAKCAVRAYAPTPETEEIVAEPVIQVVSGHAVRNENSKRCIVDLSTLEVAEPWG